MTEAILCAQLGAERTVCVGNHPCTCFSIHGPDYVITVLVSILNAVNTVVPVQVFKVVPRVLRVTHLMTHFMMFEQWWHFLPHWTHLTMHALVFMVLITYSQYW